VKRDRRMCLSGAGRVEKEPKKKKGNKMVNNKGKGRGETT
jgi:hypothetical protein